jgi:hypothetical protein
VKYVLAGFVDSTQMRAHHTQRHEREGQPPLMPDLQDLRRLASSNSAASFLQMAGGGGPASELRLAQKREPLVDQTRVAHPPP